MAADQREYLAQSMVARGYAHFAGGKWEAGQVTSPKNTLLTYLI